MMSSHSRRSSSWTACSTHRHVVVVDHVHEEVHLEPGGRFLRGRLGRPGQAGGGDGGTEGQGQDDDDRSCLDVVHQVNVVTAAAREVALIVLAAHLRTCVANAVEEHDGEAAIQEMVDVLRKTLRR